MSLPADLPPGAHPSAAGTTFVVVATRSRDVAVRLFDERGAPRTTSPLAARGNGRFEATLPEIAEGALYKLVLDGLELPDPYARFLPFGVHGPARVIGPRSERPLSSLPGPHAWSIYELHVGTFSPSGTYREAIERIDLIADLGVTAIELLPVAAFDGRRGWGYDGVALYAPFAPYGEPDDLRAFVRAAHERGLAVVLDVVYNHFGPAGNYLAHYAPEYFGSDTRWGAAPSFAFAPMRRLVLDNARYWFEEFGFDGLRLDATHAIDDPDLVPELCSIAAALDRRIFLEDDRNDAAFVSGARAAGVWSEDFHHQLRVLLTGERDGYFGAFEQELEALARCVTEGWLYTGQPYTPWKGEPRGGPIAPLSPEHLVTYVQNHDQVGNRALGTRLSETVGLDRFCSAVALLLFIPTTPLLFMGQEWAASTPFLFFSDHEGELGKSIAAGRRHEFRDFLAFASVEIPDPQAVETFERSKLRWNEREHAEHARVLDLHRVLLRLRRTDPVLSAPASWSDLRASVDDQLLSVVRRHGAGARTLLFNVSSAPRRLELGGARPLVVAGSLHEGVLGPGSSVVLALP